MAVPLLDLACIHDPIAEDLREAIDRVVRSNGFILGPEVEAFEEEAARYCQARFAIGYSSGTDALLGALMALDLRRGDEVVTTPFTFFATAGVVSRLGAIPVFADIDPETFNLDPDACEAAITERTKAIIAVHLFGQCADMDRLMEIGQRHGVPVIEDAAQAIGAESKGRRAGSMGPIGCFSFFPAKNLGAFGDGGLITTSDEGLAEHLRRIRRHGERTRYHHDEVGGNFRLDALQAAILRVKLPHLDAWTEARQENARDYAARFEAAGLAGGPVRLPAVVTNRHVFNQLVLRVERRDALLEHLRAKEIGCAVYYPKPLHLQPCFAELGAASGSLPICEKAAGEVIAIPVFPGLTEPQREEVVAAFVEFYGR